MKKTLRNNQLILSLIAVLASFFVAIIVMLLTRLNPLHFFVALIRTFSGYDILRGNFNPRYIGEFIQTSLPLILAGLSVGFAFRTGMFNIGAEGQVIMGSLGAVTVGILFDLPFYIHLPLAILAAAVFGALWAAIPGILKAKFGVHEVVVTIMLNYTALYFNAYILKLLPGSDNQKTVDIAASALLRSDFLRSITANSRMHWGFVVVIIAIIAFRFIIDRTTFGYELRAVGFNPSAAEYSGIKVQSRIVYAMIISGAFAGLAGAMLSLGTFDYGRVLYHFENYGFDGISVALLGGNTGLGILLSGVLFGILKSSQTMMQSLGIPLEIVNIVSGLIILFVAMQYGIQALLRRLSKRKEREDGSI